MSNPPSNPTPASKPKSGAPAENESGDLPFDLTLRAFWDKKENRNTIYGGIIAVLVAILGWNGYQAFAASREARIQAAFAAAASPPQFRDFARDHPGHPLAGAAWLRLADGAYMTGAYLDALGDYEQAAAALPNSPFAARCRLGQAVCLVLAGRTPEGVAAFKRLADDTTELTAIRADAAFHLASISFDAGDTEAASRFSDLVMQLDGNGTWAERAMLLRMRLPMSVAAAPAPIGPKDQTTPAVSLKLPGS